MASIIRALVVNEMGGHSTMHFTSPEAMNKWTEENGYWVRRERYLEDGEWVGEPEA